MNLGIFGAGMIVQDFLTIARDIPQLELVSILGTERSLSKTKELQTQYGIQKVYTDVEENLMNDDIDTVYIALPNHLHYSFAKKALESGKHVICEKPFTLTLAQLLELEQLAKAKNLILIEAITNQYLSNYQEIKNNLASLGDIKLVECNYSQYSSRYDAFKQGIILPAFNPEMGGGALMDINIYNIHFVVGLLGKPTKVTYFANEEQQVDTSGVLILEYPQTKAVCIGAKDSWAKNRSIIQGTKGAITVEGPSNTVENYTITQAATPAQSMNKNTHDHRMVEEFLHFVRIIENQDVEEAHRRMEHSKLVMMVIEEAVASCK